MKFLIGLVILIILIIAFWNPLMVFVHPFYLQNKDWIDLIGAKINRWLVK
jgi:hypothetical protein